LYLDAEDKFFIPAELLKYHTEVIGASGWEKPTFSTTSSNRVLKNGLGMFVFDAKSNYNKTISRIMLINTEDLTISNILIWLTLGEARPITRISRKSQTRFSMAL
jgi:hypothetical protein